MWHSQVSVPSSRSPSRFGAHTVVEGAEANVPEGGFLCLPRSNWQGLKQAARNQMIPLIDEREVRVIGFRLGMSTGSLQEGMRRR